MYQIGASVAKKGFEKGINIIQSDSAQNVVGGVVGAGGLGYGIYELVHSQDLEGAWDRIKDSYEELKIYVEAYSLELNEIITMFDTAYMAGAIPEGFDITVDTKLLQISEKEKRIKDILKDIFKDIDIAEDEADTDASSFIEGILSFVDPNLHNFKKAFIGLGAFIIIGGGLASFAVAGTLIYLWVRKMMDRFNDRNKPSGTSGGCSICGHNIWGENAEGFKLEMARHIRNTHPVNLSALASVLPAAQAEFIASVPTWMQRQITMEAGLIPGLDWRPQIEQNPSLVYGVMTALVVVGIVYVTVQTGGAALVLAPVFA